MVLIVAAPVNPRGADIFHAVSPMPALPATFRPEKGFSTFFEIKGRLIAMPSG
jgi:hypothetical protein